MQYCSLPHRTLVSPLDTSTAGCCFCFRSASSFLLELFLFSSPVIYWAPANLGSSSFCVLSFAFAYCTWGSQGKNAEMVCCAFLPWTCFAELSIKTHLSWVALHSVQFSSVAHSCLTLCDPMDCSMSGSLSITNSRSLLKLMSTELVMPSTISSSVILFSSQLQSFPASGSFQMSQVSHQVTKELELQLQHQSFQ